MDFDCWCLEGYRQEQKRYTEAENIQQKIHIKSIFKKRGSKFGTIAFRKKNVSNREHSKRYKQNEYYLQEIQVFPNNLLL